MQFSLEFVTKKMVDEIAEHSKMLGLNHDIPTWANASEDYKEMSRLAAQRELCADMTPEDSHTEWHRNMYRAGWRWGEKFDMEKKKDPRMIPYSELPESSKFISKIIKAIADLYRESFVDFCKNLKKSDTNFQKAEIETQNIYNR